MQMRAFERYIPQVYLFQPYEFYHKISRDVQGLH